MFLEHSFLLKRVLTEDGGRRAKIKLLTKKTLENGEDCDAIPESYRKYLAFQALDSGKPVARGLLGNAMGSMGNNLLLGGDSQPPPKVSTLKHLGRSSVLR